MKDCLVLYHYEGFENFKVSDSFDYILENKDFQDNVHAMEFVKTGIAMNGNRYFMSAPDENGEFDYCEITKIYTEKWIVNRIRSKIIDYEKIESLIREKFFKRNKAQVYYDKLVLNYNFYNSHSLYNFLFGFFVYEANANNYTKDEIEFIYYEEDSLGEELKLWFFNHTEEKYESIDIHFSECNQYL